MNDKKNQINNTDDSKYQAIIKDDQKKEFSKPKTNQKNETITEFENESSSYELHESIDNINSFTEKKQNKIRNFFERIFTLQIAINIFSKILIKILLLALENNLLSSKFLRKFSIKIQRLLLKMLFIFQLKLLLIQISFIKALQNLNAKNQKINHNIEKNTFKSLRFSEISSIELNKKHDYSSIKINEFSYSLYEKTNNSNLYSFSAKSLNENLYSMPINSLVNNNEKIITINNNLFNEIGNNNINNIKHGGNDFLFYRISKINLNNDNLYNDDFLLIQIVKMAKSVLMHAKNTINFILVNSEEKNINHKENEHHFKIDSFNSVNHSTQEKNK